MRIPIIHNSTAPVEVPVTTTNDSDHDSLFHKFCSCQEPLPDPEQTAYCGRKSTRGWRTFPAGTAPAPRQCIVCADLVNQPCRFCGKGGWS